MNWIANFSNLFFSEIDALEKVTLNEYIHVTYALFFLFFLFGLGYLCGSLPFGVWIPHWMGAPDPRLTGSGNMGASNVLRTSGYGVAAMVLVGDVLKGVIPVACMLWMTYPDRISAGLVGFGCILGHIFSFWVGGKGGKGVATTFGVCLVLFPQLALTAALLWAILGYITRYAVVASLGALGLSLILFWPSWFWDQVFLATVTLLIFWTHRHNLMRLLRGTEHKLGSTTLNKKSGDL